MGYTIPASRARHVHVCCSLDDDDMRMTNVNDGPGEDVNIVYSVRNGEIILDVNGRQPRLLANTKVGGKKLLESFRPDDARRFVAAVNAKKPQ